MLWRCAEHGALGDLGSGWGDWAGVRFDLGCVSAQQRAAADAIPATVRSPAAPPSLLNTAIAALWVQAIWMTRAHSISSRGLAPQ
jgi:hypothetical protein